MTMMRSLTWTRNAPSVSPCWRMARTSGMKYTPESAHCLTLTLQSTDVLLLTFFMCHCKPPTQCLHAYFLCPSQLLNQFVYHLFNFLNVRMNSLQCQMKVHTTVFNDLALIVTERTICDLFHFNYNYSSVLQEYFSVPKELGLAQTILKTSCCSS